MTVKTGELVNVVGSLKVVPSYRGAYIYLQDEKTNWFSISTGDFSKIASLLKDGKFLELTWEYVIRGGKKVCIRPTLLTKKSKTIKGYVVDSRRHKNKVLWHSVLGNMSPFSREFPKELKGKFTLTGKINGSRTTYLYYKVTDCSDISLNDVCILFTLDHILETFDMSVPKEFTSLIELERKTWIRAKIKTDQLESWTHIEHVPKQ